MMKITQQQTEALAEARRQKFYRDLGVFFAAQEPALFATLSEDGRMDFARACHDRCEHHGLRLAASVYAWADFSILIGSHFYRDVFFRDLMGIIERASPFTEREAMSSAQDWLIGYLAAVRGKENEHATSALRRVQALQAVHPNPAGFSLPPGLEIDAYLTGLTEELFPELFLHHGQDVVAERVRQQLQQYHDYYGIHTPWHLCFMTLSSMAFGAGFDFDELYPWVRWSLSKAPKIGADAAVEKLASRTRIWLSHVLDPAEGRT